MAMNLKKSCLLLLVSALAPLSPVLAQEEAEAPAVKPVRKGFNKEAIAHYNRGRALYEQGFFNKAIESYKAAVAIEERMDQAYSNLGLIYIKQNNYAKAQEAFKKALSLKPDSAYSLNGMASVLFFQKKYEEAIAKWEQAVKADPKFAAAYMNLGNALENVGRKDEALSSYVKSINLEPELADSYYKAGLLFLEKERLPQASALLQKAVSLNPESEWARDGRKKIELIGSRLSKEDGGPEMSSMRVVGAAGEIIKEEGVSTETSPSKKEKDKEKKAKSEPDSKGGGFMGKFKKKEKPATEMKMYVKQPTLKDEEGLDLQGRPQVN